MNTCHLPIIKNTTLVWPNLNYMSVEISSVFKHIAISYIIFEQEDSALPFAFFKFEILCFVSQPPLSFFSFQHVLKNEYMQHNLPCFVCYNYLCLLYWLILCTDIINDSSKFYAILIKLGSFLWSTWYLICYRFDKVFD